MQVFQRSGRLSLYHALAKPCTFGRALSILPQPVTKFKSSTNAVNTLAPQITHPDTDVSQATLDRVERFNKHTVTTYSRPNMIVSRGKGCYVYDTNDRAYLDFTAGVAVAALGHADPEVARTLYDQANQLVHSSNLVHNEKAGALAEKVVTTTQAYGGTWATKMFLSNSGTEANEGALKFARKWGKHMAGQDGDKTEIISFTNGFHGRTMGALSATYKPTYQKPFLPLISDFKSLPFNDVETAMAAITERTCGVIVEPVQGEGGVQVASQAFLAALRERCTQVNALLIFDEIQCGLGRTGKLWCHEHYHHCVPDVLTVAKALANGVPIGAILTTDKVANVIKLGDHGTTFGGNPLASAVALNVFDRLSAPSFLSQVQEKGNALKADLELLGQTYPETVKAVRGKGLLLGIEFFRDPSPLVKMARERGLLLVTASNNTVRVIPPLVISQQEAREGIARLAGAIEQFAKETSA